MKASKFSYALLSALMLAGAVAPSVSTFASTSAGNRVEQSALDSDNESNDNVVEEPAIPMGPEGSIANPELNKLTPYVSVVDNQFVLSLPEDSQFSDELVAQAKEQIALSNSLIASGNLKIDAETLSATQEFGIEIDGVEVRSYGKNGVLKVGWNYVRLGFDAGLTKDIVTGSAAAAFGAIGYAVTGPGGAAITAAVAAIVGNHVSNIKNGVWVDYNFLLGKVNNIGWQ